MKYCFTTCALNYYPNARILAQSIEEQMPGARKILMIADNAPKDLIMSESGFDEVWPISKLDEDLLNPMGWVFEHTVMELATAIKGFVLSKLLEREDCEAVYFFDPDCELHSDLTSVQDRLAENDIVLTPHTCLPHTKPEWIRFEMNQHRVGTFNLGFLGVRNTPDGKQFAKWWWDRLQRHCIIDPSRHLFTDQKWIDMVPSYFDRVGILRDSTLNLARWNTFQRHVTRDASGVVLVDGDPLGFIHYSGFLKIGDDNLGLYDVASQEWVADRDVLDELTAKYAARLADYQSRPECSRPWSLGYYRTGEKICETHRRLYKMCPALTRQFPDPFAGSSEFLAALAEAGKTEPAKAAPASSPVRMSLARRGANKLRRMISGNS